MQENHYGGEHYPANIIIVNPDMPPEFAGDGSVSTFYDANNTFWRASDMETRYKTLKSETPGKPVTVWLTNLATEQRVSVKADYQRIRSTGRHDLRSLWGAKHVVSTSEPELDTLLTHAWGHPEETSNR